MVRNLRLTSSGNLLCSLRVIEVDITITLIQPQVTGVWERTQTSLPWPCMAYNMALGCDIRSEPMNTIPKPTVLNQLRSCIYFGARSMGAVEALGFQPPTKHSFYMFLPKQPLFCEGFYILRYNTRSTTILDIVLDSQGKVITS